MVSFYENAATPDCLRALEYLRQQAIIDEFYLAGGTALALQIGHRVSTDLDWFSTTQRLLTPQREAIRQALDASGAFEVVSEQDGMMFTRLLGTDVSFIHQGHPLLEATVEYRDVQLASPTDIGPVTVLIDYCSRKGECSPTVNSTCRRLTTPGRFNRSAATVARPVAVRPITRVKSGFQAK